MSIPEITTSMVGTSDIRQGIFDIHLRRRSLDARRLFSKVAFWNTPHSTLQVLYDPRFSVASKLPPARLGHVWTLSWGSTLRFWLADGDSVFVREGIFGLMRFLI
jgi:hypothetical protein